MNSRLRRALTVLSAAALTLAGTAALNPSATADPPQTYYVYPDGSNGNSCLTAHSACATIQGAIDKASPGETVKVGDGTYPETVSITKAIALQPDVDATPSIDGSVTVGDVNGAVTMSGFAISSGTAPSLVSVTDSVASDSVTISDNTLTAASGVAQTGIDATANTSVSITGNTFDFGDASDGAAISLTANASNTLDATLGGNSGTVTAPTRTINESGDGTINITPMGSPNTIRPVGASLSVSGPAKIVTGEDPVEFTGEAVSGTDLPHARYDVTITGTSGLTAGQLTLEYQIDPTTWLPISNLAGTASAGNAITGYFGPPAGFDFPSGENDSTFRLAAADDAPSGSLSVAVALDEVAQQADDAAVNTVATDTSSVDIVANHPPVYGNQSATVPHGASSVAVTLDATDEDGDALSYVVGSTTSGGTVSGTAPNLTYTAPTTGTISSDSFTYTVSDGHTTGDPATVTISFATNHAPQYSDQSFTVPHGASSVAVALVASDADGDTLSYMVSPTANGGTVSGTAPNLTYTAPASGPRITSDSFTYTVTDPPYDTTGPTRTVTITFAPNQSPQYGNQSIILPHSASSVAIPLVASDADGDTLSYTVGATANGGRLSGPAPNLTYTVPTSGPITSDSFTYSVTDPPYDTTGHTATVTITRPNRAPVTSNRQYSTGIGDTLPITLVASDPDGDSMTFSHGTPSKGTLTGSGTKLSYRAPAGMVGSIHFTYRAADPFGAAATATITITIAKAAAKIGSVTFSPAHPTSAQVPKATVRVTAGGTVTGGTVTVKFGKYTRTAKVSGGKATVTLVRMTGGTHRLTVSFGGTSTTTSTAAKAYSLSVSKVRSAMSVSIRPNQITTASKGKATVRVSAPGAAVNGKQVTIKEGSRVIGRGKVARGIASISLPKLALGQHNWVVSFAGSSTATAVSKTVIVRVALG